ncbi:testis potassium dependent sodium/calcium exchanger [Apostichopus japonicus]|uniref:Testis potassium dependent sodium/calcium exchanger n=1 Tax=Stichopus japonicus TaxID=307972 RepID=A0A2G8KKL4_STIJA|nr:testis potassium dependent sodium/calcium exchanger [Apostichopus japonicus]
MLIKTSDDSKLVRNNIAPSKVNKTAHRSIFVSTENFHSRSLLSSSSENSSGGCGAYSENLPFWEQCHFECSHVPVLWVIFYAVCILIMFVGLALICDEFFVPSLEVISEKLELSEDVAGATFMAAGSSAPELFTSILGVTFGSDVGVGTIVGSAVFNILIIIALTAALAGQVLELDPRPLCRDSLFYALSIICFIVFSWDGVLNWWETGGLLILYALYILLMKFNSAIMERLCIKGKVSPMEDEEDKIEEAEHDAAEQNAKDSEKYEPPPRTLPPIGQVNRKDSVLSKQSLGAPNSKHIFHHVKHGEFSSHFAKRNSILVHLKHGEHHPHLNGHHDSTESKGSALTTSGIKPETEDELIEEEEEELTLRPIPCFCAINMYYPSSDVLSLTCGFLRYLLKWLLFCISFPFMCLFTWTVPNCSTPRYQRYYIASFIMSIVWIAALSFVMVTMVTKMGCMLQVDHYTMGLVVVAIGTSVPDALSSILVARDGFGDMAVSNAIGSNVFDINLGIGLPYFIRIVISKFQPANLLSQEEMDLRASGNLPVTPHAKFGFILLLILALTLAMFACVRFRLNWIIGVSFVAMYAVFLVYCFVQEFVCNYNC